MNPLSPIPYPRSPSFLILLLLPALALAQARYETRETHDPNGIGKFYMGREIAQVMGPGGIPWLERPEREAEERPTAAIAALDVREGQTVVDLGAGSGYFAFRLAPLVGKRGKVLAVDIEEAMLRLIRERATREGFDNVVTVKGTEDDPRLPEASVDLVLMVDVYHELAWPHEVMQKVYASLRPGGRVALVEYRKEDAALMIKEVHKMSAAQITREMTAIGLVHDKSVESLPWQHLMIFRKE